MHPPPSRPPSASIVRIGPPPSQPPPSGRPAGRSTDNGAPRSNSDDDLKAKAGPGQRPFASSNPFASANPFASQFSSAPAPQSSSSSSFSRPINTRPINTASLTVYDAGSHAREPHSAGAGGLPPPGMNRSSSGSTLSTLSSLSVRVVPSSPASGSAAAAYALSAGIDASPSPGGSSRPAHSLTVSSLPSSSAAPPPFEDAAGDIPSTVECFENQRYYPVAGWSSRLLPTDRPSWSNDEGTQARQFTDFKCPMGWAWTSDWSIDKGPAGDGDGWSYAVEFTRDWKGEPVKHGKHLVRRRRWTRKRQANARGGQAAAVAPQRGAASNHLSVGGSQSAAANQAANSLTVGSSARSRPATASNTFSAPPRAPLPSPVSAITRITSSPTTLSSLYAPSAAAPRKMVSQLVKVVEYQRYYPIVGWKDQLLPTDPKAPWEDSDGRRRDGGKDAVDANERPKPPRTPRTPRTPGSTQSPPGRASLSLNDSISSVSSEAGGEDDEEGDERWEWLSEWKADMTPSTDREGWMYAVDFPHARWSAKKGVEHFIRKRVWAREKQRPEKPRDPKKTVEALFSRLQRWEKDVQAEAEDPDRIVLGAATW